MSEGTKHLGLIGYPVSHSFSPAYFQTKFLEEGLDNFFYEAISLPAIHNLSEVLQARPSLLGLNVTLPHKQAILPFLQSLTPEAQSIGAVNCVVIKNQQLLGHNTDSQGFLKSLEPLLMPHHKRAMILGDGGAARAVKYVLEQKISLPFTSVVRKRTQPDQVLFDEVDTQMMQKHLVIINTTPLGMALLEGSLPVLPYAAIGEQHLLYDLVYNPAETLFLQQGRAQGAAIKNGQEMLVLQAEASWHFWKAHHGF